jgi:hypothetical protein
MDIIGIIGCLFFIIKVVLQAIMALSIPAEHFIWQSNSRLMFLLPVYEKVPPKWQWVKTLANTLYVIAIPSIIIFLIAENVDF